MWEPLEQLRLHSLLKDLILSKVVLKKPNTYPKKKVVDRFVRLCIQVNYNVLLTHARSLMIMLILGEENGLQRKNVADSFLEGKSVSKTSTFAREVYPRH